MLADNTGYKAFDDIDSASKNFLWSTLHSAEMAKGLVETLINGVAAFEYPLTREVPLFCRQRITW
ncbi:MULTISPECIES: hypothetical protein [Pseudomonas]|uniref:Uncharacterized protein n=1 Tax=Pseudomonas sp. Hg7Tf TaxID=3236988 RepID=A0AB39I0Y7_9PSED|nr:MULTISPECIES: hypothetical protein [unclassified Pseudomonas]KJK09550.1 hypothetical protein UB47_03145 [Pseudomonas sp. 5]MDH2560763.1 hypothetical protein [Pseudomonas sp. Hg5Tf]QYX46588.1 hypothetical protein K3F43_18055 [Pseudomonas sp. S11A 273]